MRQLLFVALLSSSTAQAGLLDGQPMKVSAAFTMDEADGAKTKSMTRLTQSADEPGVPAQRSDEDGYVLNAKEKVGRILMIAGPAAGVTGAVAFGLLAAVLLQTSDPGIGFLGLTSALVAILAIPAGLGVLVAGAIVRSIGRKEHDKVTFTPAPIPEGLGLAMNARF